MLLRLRICLSILINIDSISRPSTHLFVCIVFLTIYDRSLDIYYVFLLLSFLYSSLYLLRSCNQHPSVSKHKKINIKYSYNNDYISMWGCWFIYFHNYFTELCSPKLQLNNEDKFINYTIYLKHLFNRLIWSCTIR